MITQKVCGSWPNSDLYAPAPKTTHELGGIELGPIEGVQTVNLSIQPFLGCYEVQRILQKDQVQGQINYINHWSYQRLWRKIYC